MSNCFNGGWTLKRYSYLERRCRARYVPGLCLVDRGSSPDEEPSMACMSSAGWPTSSCPPFRGEGDGGRMSSSIGSPTNPQRYTALAGQCRGTTRNCNGGKAGIKLRIICTYSVSQKSLRVGINNKTLAMVYQPLSELIDFPGVRVGETEPTHDATTTSLRQGHPFRPRTPSPTRYPARDRRLSTTSFSSSPTASSPLRS